MRGVDERSRASGIGSHWVFYSRGVFSPKKEKKKVEIPLESNSIAAHASKAGGEVPSIIAQLIFLSHNSSNRPIAFAIMDANAIMDRALGGNKMLQLLS